MLFAVAIVVESCIDAWLFPVIATNVLIHWHMVRILKRSYQDYKRL